MEGNQLKKECWAASKATLGLSQGAENDFRQKSTKPNLTPTQIKNMNM